MGEEELYVKRAFDRHSDYDRNRAAAQFSGWGDMHTHGVAIFAPLLGLVSFGITVTYLPAVDPNTRWMLAIIAGLLFAVAAAHLIRRWARHANERALSREQAWLASLPFRVRGYLEHFSGDLMGTLTATITFFETANRELDEGATLATVPYQTTWDQDRLVLVLSIEGEMGYNHEGHVGQWYEPLHQLLGERLASVHLKHPIAEVSLG